MIPERLDKFIDSVVPSGVSHIGFVAANTYGMFLVTEPKGHPYGVSATFNKVKIQAGERPSQTLERCLREQVGMEPRGVYPIPVVWATANSNGFYFAGMIWSEAQPSAMQGHHMRWCEVADAERRIGESKNADSRKRDLAILAAANAICLSPYRRILLMVRELHQLGFERLRAPAYEYPLAWRCPIVPAYWTHERHGGMFDEPFSQIERVFGVRPHQYQYSSADGQFPFTWEDVAFHSPRELAETFVRERREIACAGWGPDAAYARWLEEVLDLTKPNGLYHAFSEDKKPSARLYTLMARIETVPLSPPGWARKGEIADHCKHLGEDADQE